jgi:hypothetical protein
VCGAAENILLFSKANNDVAKRMQIALKIAHLRNWASENAHCTQALEFVTKVPTLSQDNFD